MIFAVYRYLRSIEWEQQIIDGRAHVLIRDEFTVKILRGSFCDTKIELCSSWCDLCSSFFGVLEKILLELRDAFPAQPVQEVLKKKKIVLLLLR